MSHKSITNAVVLGGEHKLNNSTVSFLNDSLLRIEITEFIQKVNFWLTIMEILMVVCGILGNGLALIVINRRSLRDTSSSVFITYLAIFDISVLVVHITNLATSYWITSYILHCFLAYLTDLVTFCSVWIMVIMTLERCVAVSSPFLAKRFCTTELAHKFQQKCGVRRQYQKIIRFIKPTIFYFVPDFFLLANLFVIYELFMAKRQRTKTLMNPESGNNQLNAISFNRKQQQLTIMLVTVSLSFYLFTTPAIIDYIYQINPPIHHNAKRIKLRFLLMNLSVFWLQMSSATNFLFYCLAGSKFRAATLEAISDVYDYVQAKITNDDSHIGRRRRQTQSDICLSLNSCQEARNGLQNNRQSNFLQQKNAYPLNNSSKRLSSETIISSRSNSRRPSKVVINDEEV